MKQPIAAGLLAAFVILSPAAVSAADEEKNLMVDLGNGVKRNWC